MIHGVEIEVFHIGIWAVWDASLTGSGPRPQTCWSFGFKSVIFPHENISNAALGAFYSQMHPLREHHSCPFFTGAAEIFIAIKAKPSWYVIISQNSLRPVECTLRLLEVSCLPPH